jgi:hypothetical protein
VGGGTSASDTLLTDVANRRAWVIAGIKSARTTVHKVASNVDDSAGVSDDLDVVVGLLSKLADDLGKSRTA